MLKRGDVRINAGSFDQPVIFYNVVETQDSSGGVVRSPQVVGGLIVDAPAPAWTAWANVQPYQGQELRDALKQVGEIWAVISVRYHRTRLPRESMLVTVKLTGETYEVRGVEHIETGRKKVELTCRMVR